MDDGYECPDLNLATISRHHGDNIEKVSENECRWSQTRNDGTCVADRPLQKGDSYEVTVTGKGCVRLGLTSCLPCDQSIADGQLLPLSVGCNWHQIRFKDSMEKITVEYQDKRIWIYQSCESRKPESGIKIADSKTNYSIIINALYGDLDVAIRPKDVKKCKKKVEIMKWWRRCGLNVIVQADRTTFKLNYVNPLGLCALKHPLKNGNGFSVKVQEAFGSWHYFCIGLSNKAPQTLALDDWRTFYNNQDARGGSSWPQGIDFWLKLKCPEPDNLLYFMWKGGNSLLYQEGQGEVKEINGQGLDIHQPIYAYLEPFREQILLDSRHILLKDSGTYLTVVSKDPLKSRSRSSSQTNTKLNPPIESDPDQTFTKTVAKSPENSVSEMPSCGPQALNLGASEFSEWSPDPTERTLEWISAQQDTFNRLSGSQDDKTDRHHRISDPKDNRYSHHHRLSDPQSKMSGASNITSEHSTTNFPRRIREPQEDSSSLTSYPERHENESPSSTINNEPPNEAPPPPPTQTPSSRHSGRVPPPPPIISVAKENADADIITKNNVVLDMLAQHESSQKENKQPLDCKINNNLSNKKQNNAVSGHGTQAIEKLVQSLENSGTDIRKIPRPPVPSVTINDQPRQNPSEVSDDSPHKFVRSVTMPVNLSETSDRTFNEGHVHHVRAYSEHGPHQTSSHHRQISADELETQKAILHGLQLFGSNEETQKPKIFDGTRPKTKEDHSTQSLDQDKEQWRKCLQENLTYFIDTVEPTSLTDKLYERKCLLENEYEKIHHTQPNNNQCREIINILKRKPDKKDDILDCLDLTGQSHVADRLRKSLSK